MTVHNMNTVARIKNELDTHNMNEEIQAVDDLLQLADLASKFLNEVFPQAKHLVLDIGVTKDLLILCRKYTE